MTISILASFSLSAVAAEHEHEHISLHYQGKPATKQTIEVNKATAATLNFADKNAFEAFSKNLIAELDEPTAAILRADFSFIGDKTPDTVNPSLYRQAQLNMVSNTNSIN